MLSSNTAMAIMLAYCLASVLGHLFTGQLSLLFTNRVRVLTACLFALLVTVGMLYLMAAYDGGNPVHGALNGLLHSRPFLVPSTIAPMAASRFWVGHTCRYRRTIRERCSSRLTLGSCIWVACLACFRFCAASRFLHTWLSIFQKTSDRSLSGCQL